VGYGTIEAAGSMPSKRRGNLVLLMGGLAVAAVACAVVLVSFATASQKQQPVSMLAGTTVYGARARVQMLTEMKEELSEDDITFLRHYDQCESCLVGCDHFEVRNAHTRIGTALSLLPDWVGIISYCAHF
jgi:hypothetical protein